ncbi:YfbU family protein [Deinococcus humi]|uniref:YfbU family protein n=1 Tax=Deinococcus humi TaxID=662880 RepID=A0A7W8JS26_9DEIO|nr:YfbU family protein [Deinococcus humi]MBB5362089.1 hypothetical protein [Deinococcus humi]GGO22121.1 hypothetical protein GCM10008949_09070 [Deinococcus humi]
MKLTTTERLILVNQFKILGFLDEDEQEHYRRMVHILTNGYEALYDELDMSLSEGMRAEDSEFVYDVLDMHLAIRGVAETEGVDINADGNWALTMRGFDGNNESELLSFALFAAREDGSAYSEFLVSDRFPNSHSPSRELHQRMLEEFRAIGGASGLQAAGVEGLERLKSVAIFPERR